MENKKWLKVFFVIVAILLLIEGSIVVIVDPFFHYHAPLNSWNYNLDNERYQNNGILKYFNYDAVITGTSHTANFKTSEFDSLFGYNSVKVPLAGAQFKEIAEQMQVAIKHKEDLKCILYGITYEDIISNKDATEYDNLPTYLCDESILNDYKYVFNFSALIFSFQDIFYTITNKKTTSFDIYANWNSSYSFSKKDVLKKYNRAKTKIIAESLAQKEIMDIKENLEQNFIDVINLNKDITYCIFFTPHSIVWWDQANQTGDILKYLEAEEIFINTLLELDNVKLYSFFNKYDLICNLDKYRDLTHYSEDVNSKILKWIKNDEYLITKENKDEYLKEEREFYLNYDYDAIFE